MGRIFTHTLIKSEWSGAPIEEVCMLPPLMTLESSMVVEDSTVFRTGTGIDGESTFDTTAIEDGVPA
jgi:hypothetical protein